VFEVASKIQAFEQKLKLWQSNESKGEFSHFNYLKNFIQTSNWGIENTSLEAKIKSTVNEHLHALQQNFEIYFSKQECAILKCGSFSHLQTTSST